MSWYSRSSKMWESYCRAAELELGGGGGTAKVCRVSVTFSDDGTVGLAGALPHQGLMWPTGPCHQGWPVNMRLSLTLEAKLCFS